MLGHRTPGAREKMLLNIFDEWYFPGIERKYKPSENIRRGDEKVVYIWHTLKTKKEARELRLSVMSVIEIPVYALII